MYTHIYIYIYICVCMCVCVCVRIDMYIYIYIYTYIHNAQLKGILTLNRRLPPAETGQLMTLQYDVYRYITDDIAL